MTYLAQGCNTNSKKKTCYPYNAEKGKIDWVCGLGSQLDGWFINKAITQEPAERLAKTICDRWGYQKVKFTSSGSEACSAAVRIARAWTHKFKVLQFGYHGHHDWTVSNKIPSRNHLPRQLVIDFKSIDEINEFLKLEHTDIACVIVEPLQLHDTLENIESLELMLELCKKQKIVSIFDEIITGLRYPYGLYANARLMHPDLIVMGKAAGNGLPISWVMGKPKMMDNPNYFISSTHAGNEYCCKIAEIVMNKMTNEVLHKFCDDSRLFMSSINEILKDSGIVLAGYGTRGEWQGDLDLLTAFWELMADRGHFLGRAFFMNLQHTDKMMSNFLIDLKW